MSRFQFIRGQVVPAEHAAPLHDQSCGAYVSFEGWVRNHNEGREVKRLEYEAYESLGIKEGERIISEAAERFSIEHAVCVHALGPLELGEMAVWVGVSSHHRDAAFAACRFIIDEVKHRVPIWKKEHYADGESGWVNCEACASAATQTPPATATGRSG